MNSSPIKKGFLFGIGFCLSLVIILEGYTYLRKNLVDEEYSPPSFSELVADEDYRVLNNSHRIGGGSYGSLALYISGEIELLKEMKNVPHRFVATVRDKDGRFIDKCKQETKPTDSKTVVYKLKCTSISLEEQFEKYELKVLREKRL